MYIKTQWVNGVTDEDASLMNKVENGIYNNNVKIDAMTNIINKQKFRSECRQIMEDNDLDKIIIDTLYSDDNINKTKSTGYLYQSYALFTIDTLATIVWKKYISDTNVNYIYVHTDSELDEGIIKLYISKNDGMTFNECAENTLIDINGQPNGKDIVLKVEITGNTILNSIACGWK